MDFGTFLILLAVARIIQLCMRTPEQKAADYEYRKGVVKKGGGLLFKLFKGRMF